MKTIAGYADRLSASPGDSISFMVSCDGPAADYRASLVRLACTDSSIAGPGFVERPVSSGADGVYPARRQMTRIGSCIVVPADQRFSTISSFTVQAIIWPTIPGRKRQSVISLWSSEHECGLVLELNPQGHLCIRLGGASGERFELAAGAPLARRRWHLVAASFESESSKLTLHQRSLETVFPGTPACETCEAQVGFRPRMTAVPLAIAAVPCPDGFENHFNGKIEGVRVFRSPLDLHQINSAAAHSVPEILQPDAVGVWDFSKGMSSSQIIDTSANCLHGETINMPMRAVTGASWTGEQHDWKTAPEQYAAIYFHDDDLIDSRWSEDFTFQLPVDFQSGIYAMKLEDGNYPDYVVFFVRPKHGTSNSRIAYLASTATYLAYGNYRAMDRSPLSEPTQGAVPVLTWDDVMLDAHPEFGDSLYGTHSDGSGVCYSSFRRPLLNMRPNTAHWCFNGDQFVVSWLEEMGYVPDIITDDDLHREGVSLLSRYTVVVTGCHPEYASKQMLDALLTYRDSGGRMMYLGGNGFYWRIAYHPDLAGVIELRRAEDGSRAWCAEPGEYYMGFTGEYGGMWRRQGRAPNALVGVGFVAQGFDSGSYYLRTEASFDPSVSFIFEGVGDGERIGDFGIAGNGAAGQEVDCVNLILGTPVTAVVVASSVDHSECMLVTKEEFSSTPLFVDATTNPKARADMVYFAAQNGGAVFSVGSISWPASLPINDFQNNVSRITKNVLVRFLEPAPLLI